MLTQIELYVIQKVKELRLNSKHSQADLAHAIGVSTGFISRVESLKYNSKYNLNHINSVANAYSISPKELLPKESL